MVKEKKLLRIFFLFTVICFLAVNAGCDDKNKNGKVVIAGSTALKPFLESVSAEFMKKNPGVSIEVLGGGSILGQKQSASGAIDIGASDFPLPENMKGIGLEEYKIAKIPFVFVVNKNVKVTNLYKNQLKSILDGKILNWKELGGSNVPIIIYHRAKYSGARKAIAGYLMNGADFSDDAVIKESNSAVKLAVAQKEGSIGYIDAASADSTVKIIALDGIKYSADRVETGSYPLWTYGSLFIKSNAGAPAKEFIDFIRDESIQRKYLLANGLAFTGKK